MQHALLVRQWSGDVTFFAHTYDLSASEKVQLDARDIAIVTGEVARLVVESDRLTQRGPAERPGYPRGRMPGPGAARDVITLLITRIVTGLGAALVMPATLSLLLQGTPAERKPQAIATWTAAAGGAGGLSFMTATTA